MKKRIIIIAVCFVLISAVVTGIITYHHNSEHFRHRLSVTATVNGESIDLYGTSVYRGIHLTGEPPMIQICYILLDHFSDPETHWTEFKSVNYWGYEYEFMLPMEKTGFGRNITIHVEEKDIWEAYLEDDLNIALNLTFTDDTKADAELNITRSYRNHGITNTEERSLTKQLTLDDSYIESIKIHPFN